MADSRGIRLGLATMPVGADVCEGVARHVLALGEAGGPLGISSTLLLLPNNRAIRTMTEAFVRLAAPGLLLPRMVAVGDLALDEKLGSSLDPITGDESALLQPVPPAQRTMLVTRIVERHRRASGQPVSPAEAVRLARELAEMIDELEIEGLDPMILEKMESSRGQLADHWQSAYRQVVQMLPEYARELRAHGWVGPAERRNMLLERLADRFKAAPPDHPVIAVGITTSARAIADLLATVARLPQGLVVVPGLDVAMPEDEWTDLGSPDGGDDAPRPQETHPQYHLKRLIERMHVSRDEFRVMGKPSNAAAVVAEIFCLPAKTAEWRDLPPGRKRLAGVSVLEASDSAEEARAIAIAAREALEQPGKRVAVVTPDRELALRVSAQLKRWQITVDDSAGKPLLQSANGTLIMALATAMADHFSPVSLLAIAKHPLVTGDMERRDWLDRARRLDLLLRGPSSGIGLAAIERRIDAMKPDHPDRAALIDWWPVFAKLLKPLAFEDSVSPIDAFAAIAEVAGALTNNAIWKRAEGRQLASEWEEITTSDLGAFGRVELQAIPPLLGELLGRSVIRPPYGGHPRVAIYGLLEARLQQADLVICGGLNEATWPQLPQPDPWLAPVIRRELKLATLDRNIGLSAHDLANALGGDEVLLTRARRDRSGPTVASRFLLRIKAYLGTQLATADDLGALTELLDRPTEQVPFALRPKPMPSAEQRKVRLSITQFDQLKSDPFSFYAKTIMGLNVLEPVAAEPSYAWRGTLVHDILEKWFKEDDCAPDALLRRADDLLSDPNLDPALRALWQPRVAAGLRWVAEETQRLIAQGRELTVAEVSGKTEIKGVKVKGRADRIDKLADGSLAIIDYKTGMPPKVKQVSAGYALQLGLVGLMAERGVIKGVKGTASQFEYWSLAKNKQREFGYIETPTSKKDGDARVRADEFVAFALREAEAAIENWINGTAPFEAKLHPEYANYEDYDQLMRLQEWNGRQPVVPEDGA